jgi:uncharacterized protein (TIGR03435 family)
MLDFAQALEGFSDRPVVDKTGLSGLYKVDIPGWTPLRDAAPGRQAQNRLQKIARSPIRHLQRYQTFFRIWD